jgi:Tol biopolymer transport system component
MILLGDRFKFIFILMIIVFGLFTRCSEPTKHSGEPVPPNPPNYSEGYPSYSPDGRYLAYDHEAINYDQMMKYGQFSIWVYDRQSRHHGFLVGPGMFPRWSPNSSILAFNWGNEIFFYYMETGTVRQVTNLGREIFTMRFTPDGTRLCVTYADILLIDTTGRVAKTIRPFDGQDTGWGIGSDANWSTTGESLLVTGSFVRGIWGAVLIDSFGTLFNEILIPALHNEQVSYIAWSPHRNKFAANYQVDVGNQIYSDIRIYRMDGSVDGIIDEDAGMADWSSDGSKIAYQKYTWMGDNPDPWGIDYGRITIWETDSHGRFKHELMGWPQQGFDSTMFGGGYNWATDTHAP